MHGDRSGNAIERTVERFDAVAARLVRMLLHPRLVDLRHVCTGGKKIPNLGIDGFGISHRHRFLVAVIIVPRLAPHRERARYGGLDLAFRIGAQHFEIAQFHRLLPSNWTDDPGHRNRPSIAIEHRAGIFDIDAIERGGETIGVTFPALLAVSDDVESGALLVTDGEDGRVVLRASSFSGGTNHRSSARTRGTCLDSFSRSISHSGCG